MSTITRGYVYRIKPSKQQKDLIEKTFGCTRQMWNVLLSERETIYEMFREYPGLLQSHSYTNPGALKHFYEYMYEVDSQALTTAWLNQKNAFTNFFKGTHEKPRMKSRHNPVQSYTTHTISNNIRLEGKKLKLPKLGWVKMKLHRPLPETSIIKAATIKREAGKYYVSLRIQYEQETPTIKRNSIIGLDFSLRHLYVGSDGTYGEYPMYFKNSLDKLARAQRVLSRRKKGSHRWEIQKRQVQRIHQHIKNQRNDFLHKASRYLVSKYDMICIEDLDLQEIAKTKHFRKSISDTSYGTFTRYLEYKTKDEGKTLIKINKYYPSSKTCSVCDDYHDIPLSQREYTCDCGNQMDRDLNAAINIATQGLSEYLHKEYGTDSIARSIYAH
ncbi:transposase [Candidatus Xianfuyuplasma coldseepsis]|uniref:IS200/IS605 family element transposase accessory protein TnpB n=1 Tax=Candidatus Xianfuyuplasma coldseepsis TaxID=2782163 RepID=A0A7L7KPE9_9MOLU|nr:transposase [Xianfuyuplasma coldseepsis]QMS84573.1 IS200/IS605 family element transposase accessory protein TnpB [Xianfuyuplasma coldseepsis]